jgi:hypothetical protein
MDDDLKIVAINIHGYRVKDYRETIGKLDAEFIRQGIASDVLVYHADSARQARKMNPNTAKRLADKIVLYRNLGFKVIVSAHSNAGAVLRMAHDLYGINPDVAICIQPALPSNLNPSPGAELNIVYWNPEDGVVRLGKFLTWLTGIVSDKWAAQRNWGEMGATGYTGEDENVVSFNTMEDFLPRIAKDHSGIFGYGHEFFMPHIAKSAIDAVRIIHAREH